MGIFAKNKVGDAGAGYSRSAGPLRFRMYYWMMNTAFVYQVGGTIILDIMGFNPTQYAFWISTGSAIFVLICEFLIMPLLVAVPYLRDEYAETLWKRTIYQIARVVALIVPILIAVNITFNVLFDLDNLPEPFPTWYREGLFAEMNLFRATMGFWGYFTLFFTILFQFNRWRDSRGGSE